MEKNIVKIEDFKEVFILFNNINCMFENNSFDNKNEIVSLISILSEVILNSSSDVNNQKIYSKITLAVIDEINQKHNVSSANKSNWLSVSKELLALKYIQMNIEKELYLQPLDDDELREMLFDFFDYSGNKNIMLAHFFATLKYDYKNPKFCYDEIIRIFEKHPSLFSDIFQNVSYAYTPDTICDTIYDVCPICGSKTGEPYFCAAQALCGRNNFSPAKLWIKCNDCSNLYAYNFPSVKNGEINGHYTRNVKNNILNIKNQLYIYSQIFNRIRMYNDKRKYLEIGIGNGEMLAVALEMGYDVSAIEICKSDCETISSALDVDIKWADFLDYETDEKYDVIIMGDVLEHVLEPIKALEKAYNMLNDNGVLWLSTPNFESATIRMRKFTDAMWNQNNHFTYFSYNGLKPFLDKIGFTVKRYDVSDRYNGSMELILQK